MGNVFEPKDRLNTYVCVHNSGIEMDFFLVSEGAIKIICEVRESVARPVWHNGSSILLSCRVASVSESGGSPYASHVHSTSHSELALIIALWQKQTVADPNRYVEPLDVWVISRIDDVTIPSGAKSMLLMLQRMIEKRKSDD